MSSHEGWEHIQNVLVEILSKVPWNERKRLKNDFLFRSQYLCLIVINKWIMSISVLWLDQNNTVEEIISVCLCPTM